MTKAWGVGATALRAVETAVRTSVRLAREGLGGLFAAVLGSPEAWLPGDTASSPHPPAGPAPDGGGAGQPPPGGEPAAPARPPEGAPPLAPVWVSPQNRAVLLARDPRSLFVHWEIQPVRRIETLRAMGADGETAREVLRVFEIDTMPPFWQDIDIDPGAERAYAAVDPGRAYRVEVGLRTANGRFVALAMSNTVTTPPAEPSPDTAVHWVVLEQGKPPRDAAPPHAWTGHRVEMPATATDLDEPEEPMDSAAARAAPAGSSEQMPPGARPRRRPAKAGGRASDALPLR
jgi:hypothetical protein